MNKIKLLWYGDSPACTTGFGRVSQGVLENLYSSGKYEISVLGINQQIGDPHRFEGMFKIYAAKARGNVFGINRFKEVITKEKPDVIIMNNDLWMVRDFIKEVPNGNRLISYSPIDALPVQEEWLLAIEQSNTNMVVYTEFAKNAVLRTRPTMKVNIIGHGVDTDEFYPITDARDFLPDVPKDAFVIQCVNRNQPRKRLDLFIQACAMFANSKPKKDRDSIRCYYHGIIRDVGWNLVDLAKRWNILDKFLLTSQENITAAEGVPLHILNKIYNVADVNCTTSMGEGWGLSPFESAACGVAQIVPDSSATKELWKDRAPLIKISHYDVLTGGINTEGAVIDVSHMVEILDDLYYNRAKLKEYAKMAYEYSQQEKFTWKYIADKFDEMIKYALEKGKLSEELK